MASFSRTRSVTVLFPPPAHSSLPEPTVMVEPEGIVPLASRNSTAPFLIAVGPSYALPAAVNSQYPVSNVSPLAVSPAPAASAAMGTPIFAVPAFTLFLVVKVAPFDPTLNDATPKAEIQSFSVDLPADALSFASVPPSTDKFTLGMQEEPECLAIWKPSVPPSWILTERDVSRYLSYLL